MEKGVSVIIPVYNRKDELKRALRSVCKQDILGMEVIVVDDCSSDNIAEVIEEFCDYTIHYIRNTENRGVSFSRNVGITRARYDFIALLDSDDEWMEGKLQEQLHFFDDNPGLNVCHTEEIWIRNGVRVNPKKKHQKSGGDIFIPSLELCLMSPSSIMIKKTVFDTYGLFDEDLIVCEDFDMWLRITAHEEVGFIDTPFIIKYGGHTDQLSRKYPAMDKYRVRALKKLLENNVLSNDKKNALITVALKKLRILHNGALKRNKHDDCDEYQRFIDYFTAAAGIKIVKK